MRLGSGIRRAVWLSILAGWLAVGLETNLVPAVAQDEVVAAELYSGPQPGEPLPEFVFRELLVEPTGREINMVKDAAGAALLLVFVHEVNRPTVGFARTLTAYAQTRQSDGLHTGLVFLDADATTAEASVQRIRHALTPGVLTGVSLEGQEGPGSLGLNRKVALTILVAKDNVVTHNFALVQPSMQVDLPKVLEGLVSVVGGTVPKLETLPGMAPMANRATEGQQPPNLRPLLQPMLNKNATDEQIAAAAIEVERTATEDAAFRQELGRACKTIVDANVLANYGTAKTQEYFKKWAEAYGKKSTDD